MHLTEVVFVFVSLYGEPRGLVQKVRSLLRHAHGEIAGVQADVGLITALRERQRLLVILLRRVVFAFDAVQVAAALIRFDIVLAAGKNLRVNVNGRTAIPHALQRIGLIEQDVHVPAALRLDLERAVKARQRVRIALLLDVRKALASRCEFVEAVGLRLRGAVDKHDLKLPQRVVVAFELKKRHAVVVVDLQVGIIQLQSTQKILRGLRIVPGFIVRQSLFVLALRRHLFVAARGCEKHPKCEQYATDDCLKCPPAHSLPPRESGLTKPPEGFASGGRCPNVRIKSCCPNPEHT